MRRPFYFTLMVLTGLCACGDRGNASVPSTPSLQAYWTATPSATASPFLPTIEIILPTSTPLTYLVEPNDTLIGIAGRFNVSVDNLMAANPGVSAQFLLPGDVLIIPVNNIVPAEPTPSPLPITIDNVACYPTTDRGMWCLALVRNDYAESLENLSAMVLLMDAAEQEVARQIAFAPLNILQSGQTMPLVVFFQPPVDLDVTCRAYILTAIRLPANDPRYLPIAIQNTITRVEWNGLTAEVSGQVILLADRSVASQVWVLGVAYDSIGNAVGFTRWQSTSLLESGDWMDFTFTISSLGPTISQVDLLVEARP